MPKATKNVKPPAMLESPGTTKPSASANPNSSSSLIFKHKQLEPPKRALYCVEHYSVKTGRRIKYPPYKRHYAGGEFKTKEAANREVKDIFESCPPLFGFSPKNGPKKIPRVRGGLFKVARIEDPLPEGAPFERKRELERHLFIRRKMVPVDVWENHREYNSYDFDGKDPGSDIDYGDGWYDYSTPESWSEHSDPSSDEEWVAFFRGNEDSSEGKKEAEDNSEEKELCQINAWNKQLPYSFYLFMELGLEMGLYEGGRFPVSFKNELKVYAGRECEVPIGKQLASRRIFRIPHSSTLACPICLANALQSLKHDPSKLQIPFIPSQTRQRSKKMPRHPAKTAHGLPAQTKTTRVSKAKVPQAPAPRKRLAFAVEVTTYFAGKDANDGLEKKFAVPSKHPNRECANKALASLVATSPKLFGLVEGGKAKAERVKGLFRYEYNNACPTGTLLAEGTVVRRTVSVQRRMIPVTEWSRLVHTKPGENALSDIDIPEGNDCDEDTTESRSSDDDLESNGGDG
ncbi:hypothetical protein BJ508DRAFT_311363 [Ascobolus immersus RN42]|uniref:Uncharacterized protein n=1 Tax=Ascobolus immersus RN42 TaxID=1160509 RepID=A0A3N4HQN4_ASCIM|nr:hypothetical protein BJ508DRAFT_311363 [Ascobolus immersus RN42]